jgi:hypothetical protein
VQAARRQWQRQPRMTSNTLSANLTDVNQQR